MIQPQQSEIPDNAKISVRTHGVDTNHLHCLRKTELRLNPIPRGLAMCNRQVTVGLNFFYCFQLCYYFQKEKLLLKLSYYLKNHVLSVHGLMLLFPLHY